MDKLLKLFGGNMGYAADIDSVDMSSIPGVFIPKEGSVHGVWLSMTDLSDASPPRIVRENIAAILAATGAGIDVDDDYTVERYSGVFFNTATHYPDQRCAFVKGFTTNARSIDQIVNAIRESEAFLQIPAGIELGLPVQVDADTVMIRAKSVIECPNPLCSDDWTNDIRIFITRNPDATGFDETA